jgi:hypothetical protein
MDETTLDETLEINLRARFTLGASVSGVSCVELRFVIEAADAEGNKLLDASGQPARAVVRRSFPHYVGDPAKVAKAEAGRLAPIEAVRDRFAREAPGFVASQAAMYLHDLLRVCPLPDSREPDRADAEETISFHLEDTEELLKKAFGVPSKKPRPARGQWARDELQKAVRGALRPLARDERSWARAAQELKNLYPERAPASGEALRKLCVRLGVNLGILIKPGGRRTPKSNSA